MVYDGESPWKCAMNVRVRLLSLFGIVLTVFAANPSRAALVISEFLAENDGGLHDSDGDSPDWIELHNLSTNTVNLAGWRLTDTATNLSRWTFPATNLTAGGYLVVFASGKNRATAGAELHTNFQLDNAGQYLALVQPGGVVEHAYSPAYPPQRRNASYGLQRQFTLLSTAAKGRYRVPANGTLGTTWTSRTF